MMSLWDKYITEPYDALLVKEKLLRIQARDLLREADEIRTWLAYCDAAMMSWEAEIAKRKAGK